MLEINEFRCYEVKIEKKLAVTVSQTEDTSGLSDQKKKKKRKKSRVVQFTIQFTVP